MGCQSSSGCIAHVAWGSDVDDGLISEMEIVKYHIYNATVDGRILHKEFDPTGDTNDRQQFASSCIHLEQKQILEIDNFVVSTNPIVSHVHMYWDRSISTFGAYIPESKSSSGDKIMLGPYAYQMRLQTKTDKDMDYTELWSPLFGRSLNSWNVHSSCKLDSNVGSIQNPVTADVDMQVVELYMDSIYLATTIEFFDPIYSALGEIGGMSDVLLFFVGLALFFYLVVKRKIWKNRTKNERKEKEEKAAKEEIQVFATDQNL